MSTDLARIRRRVSGRVWPLVSRLLRRAPHGDPPVGVELGPSRSVAVPIRGELHRHHASDTRAHSSGTGGAKWGPGGRGGSEDRADTDWGSIERSSA